MINRLPPQPGEWIDRNRRVRFWVEDREVVGFEGDTISTALWANGIRILGRSFKYHRPRGIWSLANTDCNGVFESAEETNIRSDTTLITEGMNLKAVNTVGGLDRDLAGFMDKLSPFFPVGFYYKAFHTPRKLFPFYESKMRDMAGLGSVNSKKPLKHSPKRYDFCDVLVVGSGPSGLSAAIAAAEQGLKVHLVEENPQPGGTLCFQAGRDPARRQLRDKLLERARCLETLEIRVSTMAAGYYADHWVALIDPIRMTKLRARSVVVAGGCYEQPAVFRNNDLPGVMLASAAQRLVHQYAVRPFREVVVLTANRDGYEAALDLHAVGIKVAAIADLRSGGEPSDAAGQVRQAGIFVHKGSAVYEAIPCNGKKSICGALLCNLDEQGNPRQDGKIQLDCDGISMSVGWAPADGLLRQGRTRMSYCEALEQYVPDALPPGLFAAGRTNGIYRLEDRMEDGKRAGLAAAAYCGASVRHVPQDLRREGPPPSHPYPVVAHPENKNFVDLDEDLQLKDFEAAIKEGYDNIELLKRYSTFGMGPSQGKHSNLNAARILSRLRGESLVAKALTTARPFTSPVSLGHLAGRIFSPHRQTPMHQWHLETGAKLMQAGNWLRPEYYVRQGLTRQETIWAEVKAVRQQVGLIDVGTLGKIEISGPDAAEFIERMYTSRYAKLEIGMSRYLLMCDESGVMIDDGVAARLAADRFYVTTTTSGSDAIAREMKRWAICWNLKVVLVNATGSYAAMNLAGPESRQVLKELSDIDLDPKAFPYLGVREGRVAGVHARLLRVGFVGEWGYEIHVPANSGAWVWDQLMEAGRASAIQPFGVEAQRILRLEKGHIIIGQDSDGLTHPYEAGMGWAVKLDKEFFIGQRSLRILRKKPLTRRLTGFALPKGYVGPSPKECHLVIDEGEIAGRVTSVTFSPTLGQIIGMAYVKPAQAEAGSLIEVRLDGGEMIRVTVVKTPFYDPENLRQSQVVELERVS
jgi:sarcosine oxidase, subunit alpha